MFDLGSLADSSLIILDIQIMLSGRNQALFFLMGSKEQICNSEIPLKSFRNLHGRCDGQLSWNKWASSNRKKEKNKEGQQKPECPGCSSWL